MPQGLEDVALRELIDRLSDRVGVRRVSGGLIEFEYAGKLADLILLRTVSSVYMVIPFDVPRPRTLLGHENFTRITEQIDRVRALWPLGSYRTLHLSAAGAESPVMRRQAEALAQATALSPTRDEGDLQMRVRRGAAHSGWEVLIRLSPRPLSARSWRVCDMPGALNAAVAAAMVLLTEPRADQVYLNPACGSGTLLIEDAAVQPGGRVIGCDLSREALVCTGKNVAASEYSGRIETYPWDARQMPLERNSVDALCLDLPFGHRIGGHEANRLLYPDILRECARVAKTGAACCLLTHQARLLEDALREQGLWVVERRTRVRVGGLVPTLMLARRRRG